MREELIKFETAVLAKEKGFDILTNKFYDIETKELKSASGLSMPSTCPQYPKPNYIDLDLCYAPTQSLLQKWLRKKHKQYVLVDMNIDRGYYGKYFNEESAFQYTGIFNKYEEALEQGLQESLKLIKL